MNMRNKSRRNIRNEMVRRAQETGATMMVV